MICAMYCLKDVLALFSYYLILHFVFKEVLQKGVWRSIACACFSITCSAVGYLLLPPRTEGCFILEYENDEKYPDETIKVKSLKVQGVARHVIKSL